MFVSCRNFCGDSEKQHELVVYEAEITDKPGTTTLKDLPELGMLPPNQRTHYSKLVKSSYATILKDLLSSKKQFTDPEFPPSSKSMGEFHDVRSRKIVWRRLSEIVKAPIFLERIDSVEMMEGNLGDCYFFSSLAALAENPDRIRSIFPNSQINSCGVFLARVTVAGVAKQILIDDWFPVYEQNNQPVFAKPLENEVWPMVIEKVWAKLSGAYSRISSGYPHEVLSTFTSAPCFYSQLSPDSDMTAAWRYLLVATSQGYVATCGSRQKDPKVGDDGIVDSHTYTLLGSYEIEVEGGIHRLVKLRNPWDFKRYRGRFSKDDLDFWRKVEPSIAKAIGFDNKQQNGVIFMSFPDFLEKFQSCDISHTLPTFSYNFESFTSQRKHGIYFDVDIKCEKATECYFTLHQDSLRKGNGGRYSRATIVIGMQHANGSYHYIASKIENNFPSLSVKCRNMEPGKYIIYCKIEWAMGAVGELTLSAYSPSVVEIGRTDKKLHPSFIRNVMLSHAFTSPHKQRLDSSGPWICTQLLYKEGGYAYIVACVESGQKKIVLDFSSEDFLKAGFKIKGLKHTSRVKLVARLGEPQIVLCRILETSQGRQLVFPPEIKISQSI